MPEQIKDGYWHGQYERFNEQVAQADNTEIVFFGNSITWIWSLGSGTAESLTDQIITNIGTVIQSHHSKNSNVKIVLAKIIPIQREEDKINLLNLKISRFINANFTILSPIVMADQHTGFVPSVDLTDKGIMPTSVGAKKKRQEYLLMCSMQETS